MIEHDAREVTTERHPGMDQWLLRAQAWWDAQRFDQPGWDVATWRDQKARHIQLHVAKALGKVVAAYDTGAASPVSHIQEAIAHLHAGAEALATSFAVDLAHAHRARLEALLGAPLPASLVEEGKQALGT